MAAKGGILGMDYRTEDKLFRMLLWVSAIIILFVGLFPIYWMAQNAVKSRAAISQGVSWYPTPATFTMEHFISLYHGPLRQYFINSVIVTVGTIILVVVISLIAGYGLARLDIPQKENFAKFLLFGYMFNPIVLGLPLYLIWREIGLLNTHLGLILAISAISMPFTVWLMWKFIQTIPESMEESAWVVGASRWKSFFYVIVPQTRPAIVATAIFAFALAWTDFTFAQILIPSNDLTTFAPGIMRLVISGGYDISWGQLMAAALIMTIPPLVFAYTLQSYLLQGFQTRNL